MQSSIGRIKPSFDPILELYDCEYKYDLIENDYEELNLNNKFAKTKIKNHEYSHKAANLRKYRTGK